MIQRNETIPKQLQQSITSEGNYNCHIAYEIVALDFFIVEMKFLSVLDVAFLFTAGKFDPEKMLLPSCAFAVNYVGKP